VDVRAGTYSLGDDAHLVIPERGAWLVRVYTEVEPSTVYVSLLRAEVARRYRRSVTLSRWRRDGNCYTAEVMSNLTARRSA
jgi:hypothetical protein